MSDKLDASAAKVLDKISEGTEAAVTKLGAMADKYGPEVVDSALWVVRVNGLQTLAFAAAGFLLGAVSFALFARPIWRWMLKHLDETDGSVLLPLVAFWCATGALAFGNALTLLNVWHWVAIFEPKLWVAKRLLNI